MLCRFTRFFCLRSRGGTEREREKTLINIRQENTCDSVFWGHVDAFFRLRLSPNSNVYLALLFWQCGNLRPQSTQMRTGQKCCELRALATSRWNHFAFIEYSKASNSNTKRWLYLQFYIREKGRFQNQKLAGRTKKGVLQKHSTFAATVSIRFGLNRANMFSGFHFRLSSRQLQEIVWY